MSEPFVIDTFDDSLVVMPLSEARRLAALNRALEDSSTWRELQAAIAEDPVTIDYLKDAYDGELPDAADPVDPEELPGFADGDWPLWPKRAMLDWLPASVVELGTVRSTLMNDPYLELDASRFDDVVAALAAENIECYQDRADLVTTACGAWRYGL